MMRVGGRHGLGILLFTVLTTPAFGQTFSSGSTGALGAFNPASNTTVVLPADGILNYTTVNIPAGVTVTFQANSANTPVTMLAQGNVTIAGTINVSGTNAAPATGSSSAQIAGSLGGPGGFAGGQGGLRGVFNRDGAAGRGPGGGGGGRWWSVTSVDGAYGAGTDFVTLIPLFGGSGGGGGVGDTSIWGAGGGGGGGAVLIASTTQIVISPGGVVRANGGAGYYYTGSCDRYTGAGGSGGAIRLVAPTITHQGLVEALGGAASCTTTLAGIPGRLRVECTTCTTTGTFNPAASLTNTLGPVSAAGTPALTNLPTLTISAVGGTSAPANPGGSYTTPDITLSASTANPVPVTLNATNIPVGTIFIIRVLPGGEPMVPFLSTPSTGSFASSTASAHVNLSYGKTSLLFASVGYTQVASLLPEIDGEPVEHILVEAGMGEPSSLSFRTTSGKEVALTQMPQEMQIQMAMAFERVRGMQSEPRLSAERSSTE
jgi:hypothetical protein